VCNLEDNDESMMINDESHNDEDEPVDDHVNKGKSPTALAFLLESDSNDADMVNNAEVWVNRYLTEPPLKFDESGNCSLD